MSELIDREVTDPNEDAPGTVLPVPTTAAPTGRSGGAAGGPAVPAAGAAPGTSPDPQKLIDDENRALGEVQGRWDLERAGPAAAYSEGVQKLTDLAGKPAQTVPLPQNSAQHIDPKTMTNAAALMMTLGALGGLLTKRPMTAALNNMAGALKGLSEGDAEQYDAAIKDYKIQFDKAIATNKQMLAEKEAALTDTKLSLSARMQEVQLIDAKYGNELSRTARSFDQQWKMIDANRKALNQAEQAAAKMDMAAQRLEIQRQQLGLQQQRLAMTGPGGAAGGTQEDLIEGIASGRINPNVVSIRNNERARIMQEVARRYPDYDMKTFVSRTAAERAFTVGKQADAIRSFGVSDSHLKTLDELGTALQNGDVKAINRLGNYVASQTGQAAPVNFEAAKRIVADEIVKAVTGAAGALGDRETADHTLDAANSPEQLKGVIATYRKLIGGQLEGLRHQYEAGTGKTDFDTRFRIGAVGTTGAAPPAAIEYLKQHPESAEQFKAKYGYLPP